MKTELFLTRHGETEWNVEKKFQGWGNSPLTKKGIEQGKFLNKVVEKYDVDVIYSSPQERALVTAQNARGNKDIPIIVIEDLKEICLGAWEGKTYQHLRETEPENFKSYMEEAFGYYPEGGESRMTLVKRAIRAKEKILKENPGKKILVVTHGMTLMTLIHAFSGVDLQAILSEDVMPQTSITHIILEDNKEPKILLKGDTSHFEERR